MEKIHVNIENLDRNSRELSELVLRMEKSICTLREKAGQMNNMWEGEAREAFQSSFEEELGRFGFVPESFRKLADFEKKAAGDYKVCEDEVSRQISCLSGT